MAKKIELLAPRQIDTLGAGFHSDGGNLYLRVKDTGARSWVFRYKSGGKGKVDGQVTELGLGSRKERTLKQARELAGKMRTALANGENPAALLNRRDTKATKFEDYAKELIETKRSGWRNAKHAKQWTATLEQYAYPTIGGKLPADVTLADVKAILLPMWATKTETASRLRQRIEAVLDFAAVEEKAHGRYNPAMWKGNLDKVLPAARKVSNRAHHAAADYIAVPGIMSALRDKDFLSAYCLRFTILTAARSGEARGAMWDEIDFAAKTWTIPDHRMKAGNHAKQRMVRRRINLRQVMECLRKGRIFEPAHLTIQGDWKATLEHQYAGDAVKVAVAIEKQEDGDLAVVVTVID